jgi:hypothetical protein
VAARLFAGVAENLPQLAEGAGSRPQKESLKGPAIASLKMKGTATPLFRSNISDGFREVPAVSVKVLSIILALTIGLIDRFRQDNGSIPPRPFAMTYGIFDTKLNDMRFVGRFIPFGNGHAALARFHLDAVIGDAETDGEPKSL